MLYDCRDCGAAQAGFWHCRDRRTNRNFWIRWSLIRIGSLIVGGAAALVLHA